MTAKLSEKAKAAEIVLVNWKSVRGQRLDGEVEYIGRYHPEFGRESPLKNEWSHLAYARAKHKVETAREAVDCFYRWLLEEVKNPRSAAYRELERLARIAMRGRLFLACWCLPHDCHGEIVVRSIRWMITQIESREAAAA